MGEQGIGLIPLTLIPLTLPLLLAEGGAKAVRQRNDWQRNQIQFPIPLPNIPLPLGAAEAERNRG